MDVVISGMSGMIGTALAAELRRAGHRPIPLVRRRPQPGELHWSPDEGIVDVAGLEAADALVHLAAPGIGDRRWSADRRRVLLKSRVKGTSLLAGTLGASSDRPRIFLSASAIGYYGDRGSEWLTEEARPGEGFLAELVEAWESAAKPAAEAGVRTVLLRSGIIEARHGGALSRLLLPFRLGLGGPVPPGSQYMSWISLTDQIRAIVHLLTADLEGPVNLVGPAPVTNREHARALGRVLRRPAVIPTPMIVPKLLYGSELVEQLLVFSQRVSSAKLAGSGFDFRHRTIDEALRSELD